jgi:hypothetical protein
MGEGAIAPLINDSINLCDRYRGRGRENTGGREHLFVD